MTLALFSSVLRKKGFWWCLFAAIFTIFVYVPLLDPAYRSGLSGLQIPTVVFTCFGVLGIWALGLRRRVFRAVFWKIYLLIDVVAFLLCLAAPVKSASVAQQHPFLMLAGAALFMIPYYTGLYVYGFKSELIWER